MKIKNGYRLNKNGKQITTVESEAVIKAQFEGNSIKEEGIYYFFNRKQGSNFIYLP